MSRGSARFGAQASHWDAFSRCEPSSVALELGLACLRARGAKPGQAGAQTFCPGRQSLTTESLGRPWPVFKLGYLALNVEFSYLYFQQNFFQLKT